MRLKTAAVFLCFISLAAASAYAYEFHLLNGMVVTGELAGFADNRFHVNAVFGSVVIDADKLDYIIVSESDKSMTADAGPGIIVETGGQGQKPESEPVPSPPEPLKGWSIQPSALNGWTLK